MADDLGIKRCWFHGGNKPHYDIPKRRIKEIQEKCTVVSSKELVETLRSERLKGLAVQLDEYNSIIAPTPNG